MYDGTVLEYLVAQDEECKLLTVGSWYAMTGYAAAFPRNSKHFDNFNKKIMDYSENGKEKRKKEKEALWPRYVLTNPFSPALFSLSPFFSSHQHWGLILKLRKRKNMFGRERWRGEREREKGFSLLSTLIFRKK